METQTKWNIVFIVLFVLIILFIMYQNKKNNSQTKVFNEFINSNLPILNSQDLHESISNVKQISYQPKLSALHNSDLYSYIKDRCVMLSCNNKYQGSGFFIKNEKGNHYIITCAHVVSSTENGTLELCDDIYSLVSPSLITYRAEIVCVDTISDVALLKINSNHDYNKSLPTLEKNQCLDFETSNVKTSDDIMVVGYPLGINSFSLSSGKVRDGKFVSSTMFIPTDMILINCPVYQGNSGSPVINQQGKVVSILNFVYQNDDKIYEGFGGGVKCDILSHIANQMIEFDSNPSHPSYDSKNKIYKRPFLGLTNTKMILFYNIPTLKDKYNFKENKAIGFKGDLSKYRNSLPSDFHNNNIITKIDNQEVGIFHSSVGNILLKKNIGETITIEYYQMSNNKYESSPRSAKIKLEEFPNKLYAKEDMKSFIQYECKDGICSRDVIEEKIENYL